MIKIFKKVLTLKTKNVNIILYQGSTRKKNKKKV